MDSLDENLNLGVNSFVNFKKDLNDINQQIKEAIKNILNNNNFNNNYDLLKNNINNLIFTQEKLENEILKKKEIEIKNAFINNRTKEISSMIEQLKNSLNEITNKKINFENDIQKGQNEINIITQKEIELNSINCFMPNDIKKKKKI